MYYQNQNITSKYFSVDDVFVRKDLHEGKYAPDLRMQKLLEGVRDYAKKDEYMQLYDNGGNERNWKTEL